MLFTLNIGLQVSPSAAFKALTPEARSKARAAFFAEVAELLPKMVTKDTDDPGALLEGQLAEAGGGWSSGAPESAGVEYRWDERTQSWICYWVPQLMKGGQPFTAKLEIEGVGLMASYSAGWTHSG